MINLLIANSSGKLTNQIPIVQSAFQKASEASRKKLGLDRVDVLLIHDPSYVIPEVGIGGHAYSRHYLYFPVDGSKKLNRQELYATLCHEFHHTKRYDGPGYGKTLFDRMVFEGLAIHFGEEVGGKDTLIPKYVRSYRVEDKLIKIAKMYLDAEKYDNYRWFYQDPQGKLPRWAGHIVGYHVVGEYLEKNKMLASEAVLEPAASFRKSGPLQ